MGPRPNPDDVSYKDKVKVKNIVEIVIKDVTDDYYYNINAIKVFNTLLLDCYYQKTLF